MLGIIERPLKKGLILRERYQLLHFIGKGSYGLVYRATDLDTKEIVIVKQARNRKKKERSGILRHEADTLLSLNHPAIPHCIDYFEDKHKSFLVMELKKGENVEDLIFRDGKIYSERESLKLLLEVLKVVQYLHDRQIIHRDLRLPNILIEEEGISIIDFGLSANLSDNLIDPDFGSMSFEKKLFREHSVNSDFYALGHFLLFLLYSSYEPSSEKEKSWEEELLIQTKTKIILRKLLQLDKSYKNTKEVIIDLQQIL